jgi:hypothetical protein
MLKFLQRETMSQFSFLNLQSISNNDAGYRTSMWVTGSELNKPSLVVKQTFNHSNSLKTIRDSNRLLILPYEHLNDLYRKMSDDDGEKSAFNQSIRGSLTVKMASIWRPNSDLHQHFHMEYSKPTPYPL